MANTAGYTPRIVTRIGILAVALTLLSGGSCLQTERPYLTDAQDVLQAVLRRGRAVQTLRAEARVAYHTRQEGPVTAALRLMAEQGGSLRLDLVTPFDTPLITVVTHDGQFTLLDARSNQHRHGPASPCNLEQVLGVALSPDDLLTILGGSSPLIAFDQADLAWDGRATEEVLTLRGERLTQTLRLDGDQRRWDLKRSVIVDHDGRELLAIDASAYRLVSGIRLPHEIHISQEQPTRQVTLSFRRVEINLDLPAQGFSPLDAGGLPSSMVDCPAGPE